MVGSGCEVGIVVGAAVGIGVGEPVGLFVGRGVGGTVGGVFAGFTAVVGLLNGPAVGVIRSTVAVELEETIMGALAGEVPATAAASS
jgi:hypothetical protein